MTRNGVEKLVEVAVAVQEQNVRFTLGVLGNSVGMLAGQAGATWALLEQTRARQQAIHALAGESVKAYAGLLYGQAPEGVAPRPDAPGLPIDDYDRLDVEELGRKLEGLRIRDVERLKAHERRTRNRHAMMERLDRALV